MLFTAGNLDRYDIRSLRGMEEKSTGSLVALAWPRDLCSMIMCALAAYLPVYCKKSHASDLSWYAAQDKTT